MKLMLCRPQRNGEKDSREDMEIEEASRDHGEVANWQCHYYNYS